MFAIVGSTASGKTSAAVRLARARGDCELVSVDAMAVYRGLDIGTAKPTAAERAGLSWHGIDLVDADEEFSVARFQPVARTTIDSIEARGHRAVLVGGTGLYHRAVIDSLVIPARFPELAGALEAEADQPGGLDRLHTRLVELDTAAAERAAPTNRRRIVRALEVTLGSGRTFSSYGPGLTHYDPSPFTLIGLRLERIELERRIVERLDAQLASGFVEEVAALRDRPGGLSRTAAEALGYRELLVFLDGGMSLATARGEIVRRTRAFARRQESWFRRDPRITWIEANAPDLDRQLRGLVESGA